MESDRSGGEEAEGEARGGIGSVRDQGHRGRKGPRRKWDMRLPE